MLSLASAFKIHHSLWSCFREAHPNLTEEQHLDSLVSLVAMWFLGKIRENMESLPTELSRYMRRTGDEMFLSSKSGLNHNLHSNILTPDKIPEFCLPPRIRKRSPLLEAEAASSDLQVQNQIPKSTHAKTKDGNTKNGDANVAWQATKRPLPFSAEVYGLGGIYESPNTRRKESLFHSSCSLYVFDKNIPPAAPSQAKKTSMGKKTLSGFLPLFSCRSLSEAGSTENETPSSRNTTPLSSLHSSRSSLCIPSAEGRLKGATSCPSLIDSRDDRGRWKSLGLSLTTSSSDPVCFNRNSLLPLDVLQCQDQLRREHVFPLQGRGNVRLSAERSTLSTNTFSSLSTVRVRVVSVEGLHDETDQQTLNCVVSVCLIPGKRQQQRSATIRNRCSPVFNEDFVFTELSRRDLLHLQLKLKVVDKSAAGSLRRGVVIGVFSKPLRQLLLINKETE